MLAIHWFGWYVLKQLSTSVSVKSGICVTRRFATRQIPRQFFTIFSFNAYVYLRTGSEKQCVYLLYYYFLYFFVLAAQTERPDLV